MRDITPFGSSGITPFGGASRALSAHGSADWMGFETAKQLGLYDPTTRETSLLFARGMGGPMHYGLGGHALVFAPTRSGKGVCFVIPNLLHWKGSAFCIDPKGELAHFTSDYRRKEGQNVYVLDPCRVSGQPGAKFNPLDWLLESHDLDTDLRSIVSALTPSNSGVADFWNNAPRDLLLGIIMYQLAVLEEPKTLGRTYEILTLPENEWDKMIKLMAHCNGISQTLNEKVRRKINGFRTLHLEHQQYHKGTLQYHLAWLSVSAARDMVSKSDFDMREIKEGRATVYVCIPAGDSETYEGFTRVLTNLALKAVFMWQIPPGSKEPPILLLLDEFATTVGRMRVFDDAYTNIAGYGGRFAIIVQSIDQLQSLFPERKGNQSWVTVYENAGLRLFIDPRYKTADFVSEQLGQTTYTTIAPIGGSKQIGGPLLRSNDVAFPTDDNGNHIPDLTFAFVHGFPPIRAKRLNYFKDAEFAGKFNPNNVIPTFKPTGLTEYQEALGLGRNTIGASRLEVFVPKSDALIAKRDPLPEPPAITPEQQKSYVGLSGWED